MTEFIFWLGLAVILFIIEAITVNLVTIWFGIGSVAAFIVAVAGGPIWLQAVLFIVVTVITLLFTRPLIKKYVDPKRQHTNADMVLEKTGVVTENIDNDVPCGTVSIGGKLWSARSEDGAKIESGTKVCVLRIEGVKLIVRPQ